MLELPQDTFSIDDPAFDGLEPNQRFGNALVAICNAENPHTDVNLKAGILTARALCVRASCSEEAQAADFDAIDRAVLDIEKRTANLESVGTAAERSKKSSEEILSRVRIDHGD